jgi:hypothetical protein
MGKHSFHKAILLAIVVFAMIAGTVSPALAGSSAIPGELRWLFGSGSATGGKTISLRVTLWGEAPAGGAVVKLTSSSPVITPPSSATVPAGATEVIVKVKSLAVHENTPVTITATYNNRVRTKRILILRPYLSSTTIQSRIRSGGLGRMTVRLSGIAPQGGITVFFNSNRPSAVPVPSSLYFPAGKASVTYIATGAVVHRDVVLNITAKYRGITITKETILRKARTLNQAPLPTATATATATATDEPTATATATDEPTATATATDEPTATATDEPTATATATDEPTATATATDEPTATATATEVPANPVVVMCHMVGDGTYNLLAPHASGIVNGHIGEDMGDIIPPFEYQGESYVQNWDEAGQAIFNNGCVAPVEVQANEAPLSEQSEQNLMGDAGNETYEGGSEPESYTLSISSDNYSAPKGGTVWFQVCLSAPAAGSVTVGWYAGQAKFDDDSNIGSYTFSDGEQCMQVAMNGLNRGNGAPTGSGNLVFVLDDGQVYYSPEATFSGK